MGRPRCPFCKRKLEIRKEHEDGGWSAYCTHCTMDAGHFSSKKELKRVFKGRKLRLKRCPLCDNKPEVFTSIWDGKRYYTIRCNHCHMDVGAIEGEEKAAKVWNSRGK